MIDMLDSLRDLPAIIALRPYAIPGSVHLWPGAERVEVEYHDAITAARYSFAGESLDAVLAELVRQAKVRRVSTVCSTCHRVSCAPINHAGWHPDDEAR